MSDGIFRRKSGFTVVQNQIARDKNISLKAKGLYLVIQSYITMPDVIWKKSDFEKFSTDGKKSFETSWKELRDAGYVKWHRVYIKETGKFRDEFELLDLPKEGPYGFFYDKKGELSSTKGNVILEKDNVDNFSSEEVDGRQTQETSHHTLFGVDGKGIDGNHVDGNHMDGNHVDGNGDDNYNNYTNNNLDYNNSGILSHHVSSDNEVSESMSKQGQDRMGQDENAEEEIPVVVLDRTVLVDEIEAYNILGLIKESNGIPYNWQRRPERLTQAIQILGDWNEMVEYGFDGRRDSEAEAIYVCMVKNLAEMCLSPGMIRVGENRKVSYAKVIDQINSIYHSEEYKDHALSMFFNRCVRRFKDATVKTKIQKVDEYCKTLLWNALSSYEMDWNGYFNRTYYGDWSE